MWKVWPVDEIQADLDLMQNHGMNAIRFFLLWEDFQPEPGKISELMLDRLETFLIWCRERNIWANPSLFIGWMSGKAYFPQWKAGRNMFTDPEMVNSCRLFCREVGARLAMHGDTLFAVDLGNELNALPESRCSPPTSLPDWCGQMTDSLRASGVKAPLLSGCDHNQVFGDCGWRPNRQPGTDGLTLHSYPVPTWVPVRFPGRNSQLALNV
jgi:endo-1,4-beta-mannosidase